MRRIHTRLLKLLVAAALLAPAAVPAKIDLVTLPSRDVTELTIYNSQDLTLTRETRTLSFSKGKNEIQFSWANTLIDPTSLRINVDASPSLTVIDAVYPAGTKDLVVWNIEATEDTSAPVNISYFTSGLSWSADYVVKANADESALALQQFTTVRNNSGEDFTKARTRVVVGEVNLVDLIADLARRGVVVAKEEQRALAKDMMVGRMEMNVPAAAAMPTMSMDALKEAKQIIKQAVSEYRVFAVEGEEDILNGWGKELPQPVIASVPFDLSYEIDPHRYGNQAVKFYKFKNDTAHKLGQDPLPVGQYYVYTDDGRQGLRLEGQTNHKYAPVGEDVELNLGSDGMVLYKETVKATSRSDFQYGNGGDIIGWDDHRTVELEIKNARTREIPLKLTHHLSGDWEFDKVSLTSYEKVDAETIRWEIKLPPQSTTTITYDLTERQGSRVRAQ